MKKTGILVGAAPIGKEIDKLLTQVSEVETCVFAVDGGAKILADNNILPDYWIGDMDSIKEADKPNGEWDKSVEIIIVPVIKDDTDMALALNKALEKGCDTVFIYGGTGGERMDHTLANIQLMKMAAKKGIEVHMIADHEELIVLDRGEIELESRQEGNISVFALSDIAKEVSIKGLFYEYEGNLTSDRALGVSNHFCGKKANISVVDGTLLIVLSR